jgi:glutamate-1-semialdehyde 2,1-aminomutase
MELKQSLGYQDRAKKVIPGMGQLLSKRPDMFSLGAWPSYYSKAKGAEVWDLDGNRYIDMSIAGIGANVLGYADPDVDAAVKKAVDAGSSSSLNCPEEVELAEKLCELHPWAEKVRFARTGGESMAIAVRIARAFTGREVVAVCGYHGWHDWYLAANIGTDNALGEHLLPGLSPLGVPQALRGTTLTFRYNHPEDLETIVAAHQHNLAAVIMEPIRNIQPTAGFLASVKRLASNANAVLIFDEISAGFRMNTGGAHLGFDVSPDIAVFSKALGNGFPIAAVIGKASVMDAAQLSFISSTMWTERIGPAAALATIRKHAERSVGGHLMAIGKRVQDGWTAIGGSTGIPVVAGGIYPLSHFSFEDKENLAMKAFFIQEMLEEGFLTSNLFYPMLAHTEDHVRRYLDAVERVFKQIAELKSTDKLLQSLKGKPANAGFKRVT